MAQQVVRTQTLVEKLSEAVDTGEDDIGDWAQDCEPLKRLANNLSYSKMKNELDKREPRMRSGDGKLVPVSICGSGFGCHCGYKRWRRTDLAQLGAGINLYFKMLKYFGCLFFLFFILSIPSVLIYTSGNAYNDHYIQLQKFFGSFTVGNLNQDKEMTLFTFIARPSWKTQGSIEVECPEETLIEDVVQFGLAYKDRTAVGFGLDVKIETVDGCTFGTTDDVSKED